MKSNSTLVIRSIRITQKRNNQVLHTIRSVFFPTLLLLVFGISNADAQAPVPSYPTLTFNSPSLISGTDLQVGAVYTFPNVETGVDCQVTIMGMTGGAWLSEIDNTAGAGYYDAFQPYVGAGENDTSYIDWKFVFKKAGTAIDTTLATLAVTGVDVDGDASALKEFIQAATPGSFALDPSTHLDFFFDGVRSTATSTIDNYANIDTANTRSMFQMNFTNINTILYRNGAITTAGAQVRQTSIYFKSFFNWQTVLPVKLISFDAKANNKVTDIRWSAADESALKYYTVQKSTDGSTWKNVAKVNPAAGANGNLYYITDYEENHGTVYYRLQQTDINELATYSKILRLTNDLQLLTRVNSYISGQVIHLEIKTTADYDLTFDVYTITGTRIKSERNKVTTGVNQHTIELPTMLSKGIYLLVVKDHTGKIIYNNKIPLI